jgi:hypothetical protein
MKAPQVGMQARVRLASGEWYTGKIVRTVRGFGGETRFEVQGAHPRPFTTIAKAQSLRAPHD